MRNCCESLRDHAMSITTNFKRKNMNLSTKEQSRRVIKRSHKKGKNLLYL